MFNESMYLRIKVLTLPFTEIEFSEQDYLAKMIKAEEKLEGIEKKKEIKRVKSKFNHWVHNTIFRRQKVKNLDEINLLIKRYYDYSKIKKLGQSSRTDVLINYFYMNLLKQISQTFLTNRNGKLSIKYWETTNEEKVVGCYRGHAKIAFWNCLNRMFCTDLLQVAFLINNNQEEVENLVTCKNPMLALEDVQLKQILAKGNAETHIHANAGVHFSQMWEIKMNFSRENNEEKHKDMEDIVAATITKEKLIELIEIVARVRYLMMAFLISDQKKEGKTIRNVYIQVDSKNHKNKAFNNTSTYCLLKNFKEDKLKEIKLENYNDETMYDIARQLNNLKKNEQESKNRMNDVIENLCFDYQNLIQVEGVSAEKIFLMQSLKHIKYNPQDVLFSKIFWKYIVIKNEVFQMKTQNNRVKGLDYFTQYYKRSANKLASDSQDEQEHFRRIFENQFSIDYLKILEIRITFGANTNDFIDKLIRIFQTYKTFVENNDNTPALGIIVHFIKREDTTEDKCIWYYDNYNEDELNERVANLYYGSWRKEYSKQIKTIKRLREKIPKLDDWIVGIDAASKENATEPWVFAPIYGEARESTDPKICINSTKEIDPITDLKFTFHAGEDYRHMITGLRRISEAITWFKMHDGDRIGHGIVLGANVEEWVKRNPVVIMPRLEYLENMLWLWRRAKNFEYGYEQAFLEKEIMTTAQDIYGSLNNITVFNLWNVYCLKFQQFSELDKRLNEMNCWVACRSDEEFYKNKQRYVLPCMRKKRNEEGQNEWTGDHYETWNEARLACAHHCKYYLEKMQEPIEIAILKKDIPIFDSARKYMVDKVNQLGIIIETNPTSNAVIGEINSIFEHYIHNLSECKPKEDAVESIVTINADDPSVFNTNVNNEFAYIYYALLNKGYAKAEVLQWIDKVRENNIRSSFVPKRQLTQGEKIKEIEAIIEALQCEKV